MKSTQKEVPAMRGPWIRVRECIRTGAESEEARGGGSLTHSIDPFGSALEPCRVVHRALSKGTLHQRQGPLAGCTEDVLICVVVIYLSSAGL
jgi:hypothetical protein